MPQADILAHPNVNVFISHGGLFGTQEAVYNGVPILGMPIYFDQQKNINEGKKAGYALGLDYRTVTEDYGDMQEAKRLFPRLHTQRHLASFFLLAYNFLMDGMFACGRNILLK